MIITSQEFNLIRAFSAYFKNKSLFSSLVSTTIQTCIHQKTVEIVFMVSIDFKGANIRPKTEHVILNKLLLRRKFGVWNSIIYCFILLSNENIFLSAAKIMSIVKNEHLLLCTLLLAKSMAMEVCYSDHFKNLIWFKVNFCILNTRSLSMWCDHILFQIQTYLWHNLSKMNKSIFIPLIIYKEKLYALLRFNTCLYTFLSWLWFGTTEQNFYYSRWFLFLWRKCSQSGFQY